MGEGYRLVADFQNLGFEPNRIARRQLGFEGALGVDDSKRQTSTAAHVTGRKPHLVQQSGAMWFCAAYDPTRRSI